MDLNWLERWMLKGLLARAIENRKLADLFLMIRRGSHLCWYEDNSVTVEDYIVEQFLSPEAQHGFIPAEIRKALLMNHARAEG